MGKVLHQSRVTGSLVVKSGEYIEVGRYVSDEKLRSVGVVADVFGNIHSPYIAVKPTTPEPQKVVGQILYVKDETRKRRK